VSRRYRRDFLLDSGGVSALARDTDLLDGYMLTLEVDFEGSIQIPNFVMAEVCTGDPRHDTIVDRLINDIRSPVGAYAQLSDAASNRAGVLRTEARRAAPSREISGIDALLVAVAEERSHNGAVTILTGDPGDIRLLVERTRRTNIAVQHVS
jgi:hypothetical protein